jgi:orotate phosphoribosyltransferase-like protein
MKDETTNSYELTLTPNYVSDWNFNDALRELIQNGTDQEVLDPDNEFQIDYSPKEKVLRLKNRKSVLKINTLLLGRSSKANNEDTVGQFGEGYKIAALVLNRLGKTFTIYNNEKMRSGIPDSKIQRNGWKKSSAFTSASEKRMTTAYASR